MRTLALPFVVILAACGGEARAPVTHDAAEEPADAAPAPPLMPGVGGPVGVYLSVGDDPMNARLLVLDERGAREVPGSGWLVVVPRVGGGAWLGKKDLVFAWNGEALTPMPKPPGSSCCGLFAGPDDELWAQDGAGMIARWDGSTWESWTATSLGVGDRWVAVRASATRVHAIGDRDLATYDDGVWTRRPLQALGPQEKLDTLSVTHDDHVVVTTRIEPRLPPNLPAGRANVPDPDGRVFAFDDAAFTLIDIPAHHYGAPQPQLDGTFLHLIKTGSVRLRGATADKLDDVLGWDRAEAITPDGTIWASRGQVAGVLRVRPGGTRDEPAPLATLEALPGRFTVDDRGRVWVPLEPSGLAVLDGDSITVLPSGSLAPLAGRINSIAIPRGAPALPAWPAPRRVSVHGRLVDAQGKPVRRAQIEACWDRFSHEHFFEPCTRGDDIVALRRKAKTADDGTFRFDDLPAGVLAIYGRATDRRGRWTRLATPDTSSGPTDVALGDVTHPSQRPRR